MRYSKFYFPCKISSEGFFGDKGGGGWMDGYAQQTIEFAREKLSTPCEMCIQSIFIVKVLSFFRFWFRAMIWTFFFIFLC